MKYSIDIERVDEDYDEKAYRRGARWVVEFWGTKLNVYGSSLARVRYFRTKASALKFAKEYMRKN